MTGRISAPFSLMLTPDDQHAILHRLQLLQVMTVARGCTESEAAVAAEKIGRLIQEHALHVCFGMCHPLPPPSPAPSRAKPGRSGASQHSYYRHEPDFEYGYVEVIGSTEKAVFLRDTNDVEFWMPRSQLRGDCTDWDTGDAGELHVSQWWARKEGWDD